jgi:hypothetical protein
MDKQTEEVNELVKSVNSERTETAQLTLVRDYAEALRARGKREPRPHGRRKQEGITADVRRLHTALGQIARFDVETLRSGIPGDFRDKLVQRVRDAIAKLEAAEQVL